MFKFNRAMPLVTHLQRVSWEGSCYCSSVRLTSLDVRLTYTNSVRYSESRHSYSVLYTHTYIHTHTNTHKHTHYFSYNVVTECSQLPLICSCRKKKSAPILRRKLACVEFTKRHWFTSPLFTVLLCLYCNLKDFRGDFDYVKILPYSLTTEPYSTKRCNTTEMEIFESDHLIFSNKVDG